MNLPFSEVSSELKKIAKGEVEILADGETWRDCYAGNVKFIVSDGWEITIFNDCDCFDYVDSATSPDGRKGDFDYWMKDGWQGDITDLEMFDLVDALEKAPLK